MSGWVGHKFGRNSVERIQYLVTAGNRNTISRTSGRYNENVVTVASNDTYQCDSNRSDQDYYYGDDFDDGYCSNDNDVDNDNSLTEATNLIYAA